MGADGKHFLNQTERSLAELSATLGKAIQSDPNIAVDLQAEKAADYSTIVPVLDLLNSKLKISKIFLGTYF